MIVKGDASGYVRTNLEFHRTLYLRAQAPAMLGLIETVWLQAGPTMRMLYERLQRRQASDNHRKIIAALRAGDEPGLRLAIRMDVTQGLRMLVSYAAHCRARLGERSQPSADSSGRPSHAVAISRQPSTWTVDPIAAT